LIPVGKLDKVHLSRFDEHYYVLDLAWIEHIVLANSEQVVERSQEGIRVKHLKVKEVSVYDNRGTVVVVSAGKVDESFFLIMLTKAVRVYFWLWPSGRKGPLS
jgi:hypothetical protein